MPEIHECRILLEGSSEFRQIRSSLPDVRERGRELDDKTVKFVASFQRVEQREGGMKVRLKRVQRVGESAKELHGEDKGWIAGNIGQPTQCVPRAEGGTVERRIDFDKIEVPGVEFQLSESIPDPGGIKELVKRREIPSAHTNINPASHT